MPGKALSIQRNCRQHSRTRRARDHPREMRGCCRAPQNCARLLLQSCCRALQPPSPMRSLLQSTRVLHSRTMSSMAQIWTCHRTRRSSKLQSLHVAALNDAPTSRQQKQATLSQTSAKLLFLLQSKTHARVIASSLLFSAA